MRIYTRQGEAPAMPLGRRLDTYATGFGHGRIWTAGSLPVSVELPEANTPPATSDNPTHWVRLLESYFAGEALAFPLDVDAYAQVAGLSQFECAVMTALARVPYGSVVTYAELAALAGHPRAQRAPGTGMARNRLPIILPCHRVVRSDGTLGEYGSDPRWKQRLLTLEGVHCEGGKVA